MSISDLGSLRDDLLEALARRATKRIQTEIGKGFRELFSGGIVIHGSAFVFWVFVANWVQRLGILPVGPSWLESLIGLALIALVHVALTTYMGRWVMVESLLLLIPAYLLQATFLQFVYHLGFEVLPLGSFLGLSIFVWPYTAGKAASSKLGKVRVGGIHKIFADYVNGLCLMLSSFPVLIFRGFFLLLAFVVVVVSKSAISVRTYDHVLPPTLAEVLMDKKCNVISAEDQAFKGYHYSLISFLPPYIVRAYGQKTTLVTVKGLRLPIEEDLDPVLHSREAPMNAEVMFDIAPAPGGFDLRVTYLLTFHHHSNKPIIRKGVRFIFPRNLPVHYSDHFGELRPKTRPHGDQVLYMIPFREPVRKGDVYVMKVVFDASMWKGADEAWYFAIDAFSDEDWHDVRFLLSVKGRRFRSIQPAARTITGNNAELRIHTLERNSRTQFRFEFE